MNIWCLFDGSGIMGLPWAEIGHQVYCVNADGGNHGSYEPIRMQHPNIHYVNEWIDTNWTGAGLPPPSLIVGFPDCTLMAVSGNVERDADAVSMAVDLAKHVEWLGNLAMCPWMVENPVGVLSTKWRKPNVYIDPFMFGGYLRADEGSFHPKMPVQDAYTKKTGLWFGNGFVMPKYRSVLHIGKFWGWAYLGGSGPRTKQLRSLTPRGLARAVFAANREVVLNGNGKS